VQGSRPAESRTIVGNLQFDRKNTIGTGGYGHVFRGIFNGEQVAVKRVQSQILDSADNTELKNYQKLSRLNHPNIVQFKHYQEDDDFG
jgi:serine/threonine protein kinase